MNKIYFYTGLIIFSASSIKLNNLFILNEFKPVETWDWVLSSLELLGALTLIIITKNK